MRRLTLTLLLASTLSACAIVPLPPPAYYRGGPAVVVESYPDYRYGGPHPGHRYGGYRHAPYGYERY